MLLCEHFSSVFIEIFCYIMRSVISFTLQELLDSSRGFVKDDAVTLGVRVKADAPHGVRYVTLNL